jgi:DNA-binding response OmpR family regulator
MDLAEMTILVVDDEPSVLDTVEDGLRSQGCRSVLKAATGEEGLRIAEAHPGPITVLLVDVVMPGVSGPEVAERLRAVRPDTKVLFMSGFSTEVTVVNGVKEGDPLVVKPFRLETLRRKIQELLEVGRSPFSRPPQPPNRSGL